MNNIPYIGSIDITNTCNLKCLHCFNKSNELKRDELTDDEIFKVIMDIAKLKLFNFCFCGGETLLRYELLLKCIRYLSKAGTYNINMVSNGILLTDKIVIALKDAGITMIQISLDGSNEKSHNQMRQNRNAFQKTIDAIHLLEKYHVEFSVAFCPTNFNIHELPELALMLNRYKHINALRVQPLMVMGRATKVIEPSKRQYRDLVQHINMFKLNRNLHYQIQWGDPIDHLIRFHDYLIEEGVIHILSNGDLTVSPYLPLTVGNIRCHSILEYVEAGLGSIWKSKIVRRYSEDIRCIADLGKPHFGTTIFKDDFINKDLIEDKEIFVYD